MYKCKSCWYISAVRLGKCPSCWSFWTFEIISDKKWSTSKRKSVSGEVLQSNLDVENIYFSISETEFKRVFTKGIKKWALYLIAWEPGIGKSTILAQIIVDVLSNNETLKVWYFSWEENVSQIMERMERLISFSEKWLINERFKIYHSTVLEDIISTIESEWFDIIVVDSIQTIYSQTIDSPAGSVSQLKYISEKFSEFLKKAWVTGFLVWHITKWGEIAWPKYLEHIVDVVLYLEWDRFWQYRFLRAKKNRFWPSDEVGIFEMTLFGLKPVYDIKDKIIQSAHSFPGSVLTVWVDNWRPVIVWLEVLLNKSSYKYPKRSSIWIDPNRLDLILAILERYMKLKLWFFDIFVNIPWEWNLKDSWLDLALATAIYAQYKGLLIPKDKVFIGEIGLWGQILKTKLHDKRKKEVPDKFDIIDYEKIKNIVELKNILG